MRLFDRLFGRRREGRADEPGDALPTGTLFDENAADEDAELELAEGALDPDELEADSFEWDDGTDDERG